MIGKPGRIVSGEVLFDRSEDGAPDVIDLTALKENSQELRAVRGKDISLIFQEPMNSLSPVHTIGDQITEGMLLHTKMDKVQAWSRAIDLLGEVGIPKPETRVHAYTFQLSGGMRQRAMIACALACSPKLLIADEPTTALDVTTQAQILDLLNHLQERFGMAIMLITHDLGVVAEICDEVVVMYLGEVVEQASVDQLFHDPLHPYTQALLKSVPKLGYGRKQKLDPIRGSIPDPFSRPTGCPFHDRCEKRIARQMRGDSSQTDHPARWTDSALSALRGSSLMTQTKTIQPVMEVKHLQKYFPIHHGLLNRHLGDVRAVDDVNFTVYANETLALVGESGCGKTTAGRCLVRAYAPTGGRTALSRGRSPKPA